MISSKIIVAHCNKCGAVSQEHQVVETELRWRKEGPPPGKGWFGPIYPHAELQIYERPKTEWFFDCKFICPNQDVGVMA